MFGDMPEIIAIYRKPGLGQSVATSIDIDYVYPMSTVLLPISMPMNSSTDSPSQLRQTAAAVARPASLCG